MDKAAFREFVLEIVLRTDKGAATALGGGAHVRLDDAMESPGP